MTRNDHNRLQKTFINSSNFFPDVIFQLLKCVIFISVHFGFQISPEKAGAERYGDLAGQAMSLKHGMTRPENMSLAQSSDSRAVRAMAPSCWIQEFTINTVSIYINLSSITQYRADVTVTVQLPSSKTWGPVIPDTDTPSQTVTYLLRWLQSPHFSTLPRTVFSHIYRMSHYLPNPAVI